MRDFFGNEIQEQDRVVASVRIGAYPALKSGTVLRANERGVYLTIRFDDGDTARIRPDKVVIIRA